MNTWQGMTLVTCIAWGVWPVLLKQAQREGAAWWPLLYVLVLTEFVGLSLIGVIRGGGELRWDWGRWAMLAGLVGIVGLYSFANALRLGRTGPVTGMSVAYPVITIAVAWLFLRERAGLREISGAALCIAGAMLITWRPEG